MSRDGSITVQRLGIIGAGLMGGSLLRAVRQNDLLRSDQLVVVDRDPSTRGQVVGQGLASTCTAEVDPLVAGCDLVVVCLPLPAVHRTLTALGTLPRAAGTSMVVSDVTGIKVPIRGWATEVLSPHGIQFVGAHPMIGGVKGGFSSADGGLFSSAQVAVCIDDAPTAAIAAVVGLWRGVGATVVEMSAAAHDAQVAYTSHVPYLTSVAQVLSFAKNGIDSTLVGRSFADVTRRAAFDPEIMASIAAHNPFLRQALLGVADELQALAAALPDPGTDYDVAQQQRLLQAAAQARKIRRTLFSDQES